MSEKNQPNDWIGHEPATSAALLDAITTATTGTAKISRSDRILFTACEFWAAARNRALGDHLKSDAAVHLEAAEAAFAAIGLKQSASILRRGRMALEFEPPIPVQQVADSIEELLADVTEPVDAMIAEYASQQAWLRQQINR